jgi:transmembrane serine protease 9
LFYKNVLNIDYVQPACLPLEDDPNHVNDDVVLTGWGVYDRTNTYSSVLKLVWHDVMPWWDCQQTAGVGNFSDDNIICSGSYGVSINRGYYHVRNNMI